VKGRNHKRTGPTKKDEFQQTYVNFFFSEKEIEWHQEEEKRCHKEGVAENSKYRPPLKTEERSTLSTSGVYPSQRKTSWAGLGPRGNNRKWGKMTSTELETSQKQGKQVGKNPGKRGVDKQTGLFWGKAKKMHKGEAHRIQKNCKNRNGNKNR